MNAKLSKQQVIQWNPSRPFGYLNTQGRQDLLDSLELWTRFERASDKSAKELLLQQEDFARSPECAVGYLDSVDASIREKAVFGIALLWKDDALASCRLISVAFGDPESRIRGL